MVHGDLLTWMRHPISLSKENPNVYGIIDVMIFNPPYVRGPNGEPAPMPIIPKMDQNNKFISTLGDVSWLGGGPDGIDVLKRYVECYLNITYLVFWILLSVEILCAYLIYILC